MCCERELRRATYILRPLHVEMVRICDLWAHIKYSRPSGIWPSISPETKLIQRYGRGDGFAHTNEHLACHVYHLPLDFKADVLDLPPTTGVLHRC